MPKIDSIRVGQLEKLGVDENNKLYWDGQPIITKQKITLEWWVSMSVIIASISTLGLFGIELLKFLELIPIAK